MSEATLRRVVFVGPSIPLDRARSVLPRAEYRGPIKRGDLDGIEPGTIVGLIDGLFAQTLAISPGELREAIDSGVAVYGAASMGALRAAEVPAVIGLGRVFEMYRSGVIERDDEVAVLLDPLTHRAVTVPLVNVRFAVERLVRTGTLNHVDGRAIVDACASLHYTERTYPRILEQSALAGNRDVGDVITLLESFDLKRDDAQLLLETIGSVTEPPTPRPRRPTYVQRPSGDHKRVQEREGADAPILVWESGDVVSFTSLVRFLKLTGKFEDLARQVAARLGLTDARVAAPEQREQESAAQRLLDATRAQWGWDSPEEAHITMRDLGLGLDDVADSLEDEAALRRLVCELASTASDVFMKGLRVELWLNGLALKRESLRLGAVTYFAELGAIGGPPSEADRREAERTVARVRHGFRWPTVRAALEGLGVTSAELEHSVEQLALARRAARPLVELMDRPLSTAPATPRADSWQELGVGLQTSPKAEGSNRFTLGEADASRVASEIAEQMGVVRIGLVGELDTLGVYIAQAFGQRSGWSSSFSSGKSETRDGARVGSIMEEVEIHAQDAYEPDERIHLSYADAAHAMAVVDPHLLGLPYDSRYAESLEIEWSPCLDLVSLRTVYVPSACLVGDRQTDDILYCPRLGGKIFSSSGLGSGFTLAEAILHAGAEYIERHAHRLAELELDNPGQVGVRDFWFVEESSLTGAPARIVERYRTAGMFVRMLDMTSEVRVPTFYVRVCDDLFQTPNSISSDGFACHADPEVALTMALLESAQTRGGYIAGGREDYSLHARSLGRHERPRTAVPVLQSFWFSNDRPTRPLAATGGFLSQDILLELEWIVDQVVQAGFPMFLVANYSCARIEPANAVRVLIPGLETTNPLATGPRARATLIRDLLPRGYERR